MGDPAVAYHVISYITKLVKEEIINLGCTYIATSPMAQVANALGGNSLHATLGIPHKNTDVFKATAKVVREKIMLF